ASKKPSNGCAPNNNPTDRGFSKTPIAAGFTSSSKKETKSPAAGIHSALYAFSAGAAASPPDLPPESPSSMFSKISISIGPHRQLLRRHRQHLAALRLHLHRDPQLTA